MKIVTPPLDISNTEGFKQDVLGREAYGKALLNLMSRSNDELVISLDGQWGEGKTTFVKMWQGLLNEAHIPNIYIDAFANDYVDDAFIAIASAITTYADKHNHSPNKQTATDFKEAAKKVGIQLFALSTKVALKAATLGALSVDDFKGFEGVREDIAKSAAKLASDFVEERLDSHAKDIELLKSFRQLLSQLPAYLMKGTDGETKPLIIIIDELDRCKPTYAVEILEKIKHLFSVEKVVFVLVMNKKQLEESVKCIYGQDIDAHAYLQKFINLETSIPKRITEAPGHTDVYRYCDRLRILHELPNKSGYYRLTDYIRALAVWFGLSLRQIEKVFTNIVIFYASAPRHEYPISISQTSQLIAFICVIKVIDTSLFSDLLYQKISYEELRNRIRMPDEKIGDQSSDLSFVMGWVKCAVMTEEEYKKLDEEERIESELLLNYDDLLFNLGLERTSLIPFYCKQLSMFSLT